MSVIFDWFLSFADGLSDIWDWLTTPLEVVGLDFHVAPIYLLVGTVAIAGLLRRLF